MAKRPNEISLAMRTHLEFCLCSHGASRDDAEDAIQSAMLAYYRRSDQAVIGNLEGWLLRVASDDWKDICRIKSRWAKLIEWQTNGRDTGKWEEQVLSKVVLSDLLTKLSAAERKILDYEARGLSREEMAACLGLTQETVKKRLYRARYKARKLCARFLSD